MGLQGAWELPPSLPPLALLRREAVAAAVEAADARLFFVGDEKSKNDDLRDIPAVVGCEPDAGVVPGGANAGVGKGGRAAPSNRDDIGSVAAEWGEEVSTTMPCEEKEETGEEWATEDSEEERRAPPAEAFCERDAGPDANAVVVVAVAVA